MFPSRDFTRWGTGSPVPSSIGVLTGTSPCLAMAASRSAISFEMSKGVLSRSVQYRLST